MITALLWLSLNIYHESRGEPEIAQIAVAQVTLNRAAEDEKTVKQVVKQKRQFSWVGKKNQRPWKKDPKGFAKSAVVAVKAVGHKDVTGGATYFHERRLGRPGWTKGLQVTARYGALVFYRERG
jgi:N-acetylmuramoyl-L-alanine amidase